MSILVPAFNISLAVTVFSFGLQAQKFQDVRFMLRQPRLLLLSLLAMFVLTPTLALVVAEYVDMPDTAKVAIVALSLSMIPPLLPKKELGAGGHASYGIGLMIFVAVLGPIVIPLLVDFMGRVTNRPYGVSPAEVAGVILELVVVPMLAGVAFGWRWPGAVAPIQKYAPRIANYVTLAALVVLLIAVFPLVWDFLTGPGGGWVVLAAVVWNLGALGIGELIGGPAPDRAIVLALSCASRHPAIALTIATTNYPGRNFAAAVIIIQLVNGIVCPFYLRWRRSRAAAVGQPQSQIPPAPGTADA